MKQLKNLLEIDNLTLDNDLNAGVINMFYTLTGVLRPFCIRKIAMETFEDGSFLTQFSKKRTGKYKVTHFPKLI